MSAKGKPRKPPDMPQEVWEAARRNGHKRPVILNGNDLRSKEFPPVRWAVEGILPAGVTLFGGREKMGKSWLALGLCIAVATGGYALGKMPADEGEALYISMEDPERRLQKRLQKLSHSDTDLSRLLYATAWEPADRGGLEDLDDTLAAHPDCRLVICDTLKRIRPRTGNSRNMYDVDYEAVQPFVPLAAKHNAAIVLIHHLNQQAEPNDPLDAFSGSSGLTAAADGYMILTRKRGEADAFLVADGKDIMQPVDVALGWDAQTCAWTIEGDAATYWLNKERREIIELLGSGDAALGPGEVATTLKRDYEATRKMMNRMAEAGELQRMGYGKYVVPGGRPISPTSPSSTNGSGRITRTDWIPPTDEREEVQLLPNSLTESKVLATLDSPDYFGGVALAFSDYRNAPARENLKRLTVAIMAAYGAKDIGEEWTEHSVLVERVAREYEKNSRTTEKSERSK